MVQALTGQDRMVQAWRGRVREDVYVWYRIRWCSGRDRIREDIYKRYRQRWYIQARTGQDKSGHLKMVQDRRVQAWMG